MACLSYLRPRSAENSRPDQSRNSGSPRFSTVQTATRSTYLSICRITGGGRLSMRKSLFREFAIRSRTELRNLQYCSPKLAKPTVFFVILELMTHICQIRYLNFFIHNIFNMSKGMLKGKKNVDVVKTADQLLEGVMSKQYQICNLDKSDLSYYEIIFQLSLFQLIQIKSSTQKTNFEWILEIIREEKEKRSLKEQREQQRKREERKMDHEEKMAKAQGITYKHEKYLALFNHSIRVIYFFVIIYFASLGILSVYFTEWARYCFIGIILISLAAGIAVNYRLVSPFSTTPTIYEEA